MYSYIYMYMYMNTHTHTHTYTLHLYVYTYICERSFHVPASHCPEDELFLGVPSTLHRGSPAPP